MLATASESVNEPQGRGGRDYPGTWAVTVSSL